MVTAFTAQRGTPDARFKESDHPGLAHSQNTEPDGRLEGGGLDQERLTAERLGVTQYSHVVVQRGGDRVDIRARDLFRSTGSKDNRQTQFLGRAPSRAHSHSSTPQASGGLCAVRSR